jgi:hypothetical protein
MQRKTARRRVSESRLECGWAQGDMRHIGIYAQSAIMKSPLP